MRLAQILGGLAAVLLFPNQVLATEPLPQRWVSAGGALSEWVVELGGEARLVGVDTTSLHPASLSRLPSIGYQRQLAAEGILSLQPQLLLGTEEMGPPPVLAQLKAAGVQVEVLPSTPDLSILAANLQRIGALLGEPQRASERFDAYRAQLQRQADWLAQAPQPAPRVLLVVGHAGGSPLAAGRGTAGAWLVEQAGGRNLPEHEGYKTLSTEALLALDPEVLVIADRRLQGDAARDALLAQNPALAATTAARSGRLLTLDPTLLVGGLGPRVPDGLAALSAAFYPARQPLTAEAPLTP
ncbi:MAG: ABC transporter substrate-binding protein [Gammaproteobacteria bacterium]|nr:ABC transporter substrate-binding protein [Gammaproteobacteria bacterium]MBU1489433.1 ABC transporter substrate-binding protein [Gammaproteobacteria bacterium]MBU2066705.1 ABC transporter substrate-binding protein [Gammaproteobacteria bacterium]MBU2137618.1 ABC transporter substrate-binding protein [Gammaproteobacteria bacterium]MBU2217279.1 ABC transporter substrate-binding protein [Gammaproteobacteria bacterium]